jgi:hypothetical protein
MPEAQALVDLGINTMTSISPVMSTTAIIRATETIRSCGSSGVAAGGVAGAAIGSAVAGIAIGLLVGSLVWRRSSNSKSFKSYSRIMRLIYIGYRSLFTPNDDNIS